MIFPTVPIVDINQACLQKLNHPQLAGSGVSASILRLDRIHPQISGNKWFKIKNYLKQTELEGKKGLLTFGGAFSNHLHAVACCCRELGIQAVGVIRGERPAVLAPTLQDLEESGMELHFVSRTDYAAKKKMEEKFQAAYPDLLLVPEGGLGEPGIEGASTIMDLIPAAAFTHVLCAIGTGTMATGILRKLHDKQVLLGIPVLKITDQDQYDGKLLLQAQAASSRWQILYDYHFGGYAKITPALISFMNELYDNCKVPTDIVYTGKLFFGFFDLLLHGRFERGSQVLIIHSGGLQGNRSMKKGALHF